MMSFFGFILVLLVAQPVSAAVTTPCGTAEIKASPHTNYNVYCVDSADNCINKEHGKVSALFQDECIAPKVCCVRIVDAAAAQAAIDSVNKKNAAAAGSGTELTNPLGKGATFYTIIQRVISLFLGMVGALALGVFVYAGITWMTAGSSDRVQKAKDAMKYAVIGLAMIGFSYAVTTFFIDALTGRIAGQVQQAQQQQPSNFATPPPVNP